MMNRQDFLFYREACLTSHILIPKFAKAVSIRKDRHGYWLLVRWNCGIEAPMTVQERNQAKEDIPC